MIFDISNPPERGGKPLPVVPINDSEYGITRNKMRPWGHFYVLLSGNDYQRILQQNNIANTRSSSYQKQKQKQQPIIPSNAFNTAVKTCLVIHGLPTDTTAMKLG